MMHRMYNIYIIYCPFEVTSALLKWIEVVDVSTKPPVFQKKKKRKNTCLIWCGGRILHCVQGKIDGLLYRDTDQGLILIERGVNIYVEVIVYRPAEANKNEFYMLNWFSC